MAALLEFECPACGGGLEFEPSSQMVKCPYCDTEFSVEAMEELRKNQKNVSAEDLTWETGEGKAWDESEQVTEYVCKSCGGELLCDATRRQPAALTAAARWCCLPG